jgi:cytochrome c-type biogenesis protein CcmH
MKKLLLGFLLICVPVCSVLAAEDFYHFPTQAEQQRFHDLTSELRCLVCQNQTLAESNAPLANDLRKQIYQHMQAGQDNKQIISYLVERYGDFILYSPPLNLATMGLWFGPLLLLLAGITYLFYYLRKHKE